VIVAVLAKRLPIASIPEQNLIASMRYDVVNDRCRSDLAVFTAFPAQRVLLEEKAPRSPPFAIITAIRGIFAGI